MQLSVMSFNIRYDCDKGTESWESRKQRLVPLVKEVNPDLIGFQEVLPHMYAYLKEHLTEYDSVGAARDDGKNEGERAAIFFKKDRFKMLEEKTFWLSETPSVPSLGWDALCVRICTYAKFLDKKSNKEFIHYNTHLDHIGTTAMHEGAKLISKAIFSNKAPAIVTGDFNSGEDSNTYSVMTSDGLCDAKYAAKQTMSYGTRHDYEIGDEIKNKSPIDYLFFTKNDFEILSYEVLVNGGIGQFTSDHYPVFVKMH